jgi:hypothetical protein
MRGLEGSVQSSEAQDPTTGACGDHIGPLRNMLDREDQYMRAFTAAIVLFPVLSGLPGAAQTAPDSLRRTQAAPIF